MGLCYYPTVFGGFQSDTSPILDQSFQTSQGLCSPLRLMD